MFFLKHELPLIIMNLWPLHGNSCKIFSNNYRECPFQGAIIRGFLELRLTTSGYGLKGQTAHSPGQRPGNIRRHQLRPARAKAHTQVNAIA